MKNLRLFINVIAWGGICTFVSCDTENNKTVENTDKVVTVLEITNPLKDTNQGKDVQIMRKDTDTLPKKPLKKVEKVGVNPNSQPPKNVPMYPTNTGTVMPAKLDTTKKLPQLVYETEPSKDLYDTTKYRYIKHPGDEKWHLRTKTTSEKEGPRHRDLNGGNMKKK